MACGLHKIDSITAHEKCRLLRQTADAEVIGDWIHTFWTLFIGDSIGAVIVGAPSAISHDESASRFTFVIFLFLTIRST